MSVRIGGGLAFAAALAVLTACSGDSASTPADVAVDVADADAAGTDVDTDGTASDAAPDTAGDAASDGSGDAGDGSGADAAPEVDAGPIARPYPEPGAYEPLAGSGVGAVTFTEEQLFENCAFLRGGPEDNILHHNLVVMYDGYLLMPWSPESGTGGLTFYDISDPCGPTTVGYGWSPTMRETHSIGFSQMGGRWAVVNHLEGLIYGGIEFWDISDVTAPRKVSQLQVPGFLYPDAYARLVLSVFWQAPYVYVAGSDNGFYVVDATNPLEPELLTQYTFDPVLRVGQIHAIGNLLIVTATEGIRSALLDISDPANPQPIPGGEFVTVDAEGVPRESYFSNTNNGYVWYARKEAGGGVIAYDIRDPSNPTYAGSYRSDGNGGYVFVKEGFAYVGESRVARVYDVRDLTNITMVGEMFLEGDLDTLTPIGHLGVLSVDADARNGNATAIAPVFTDPDTTPPVVTWAWPPDGATDLPLTSRFGVTFSEMTEPLSAWDGSVRLYETGTDPALTRVDGHISTQEAIVNFWPAQPLKPGTSYTLEIPAGGIVDHAGNAVAETFTATFTTVGSPE
jgi:hypothetical protein